MPAVRLFRRIPWLDNLLSTQVSFALGALAVFVPMFSALVRQEGHLQAARGRITELRANIRFTSERESQREGIPTVTVPDTSR